MSENKAFELTEEQKQFIEDKDISEDEVSECISEKIDEGMDQERAVATCLNMAREGSSEPEQNNDAEFTDKEVSSFMIKGSEIELVKQNDETEGGPVVNIPIQALSEDRDGDLINEKGQESIIRQLKSGTVPLVPNHGFGNSTAHYGFEDVFGGFVDGENRNGTTIGTAVLEEGHEMTDKLVSKLEQGMPVGFSVGFRVLEAEPREKADGTQEEGMEISKVDLMEVSAVGIPSNPDAVPQAMAGSIAMAKQAGLTQNQIMDTIEKAFEDTMTEQEDVSEKEQEQAQDNSTKEEVQNQENKQFSDEELQEILGVVGGALSAHMDEAMQQIEEELQGEMEEEEETDAMDEEDDDEEEMNSEPEKDASDHTEDDEKDASAESADEQSEQKEQEVADPAEKNQSDSNKIETAEEKQGQETEKSEEESFDPFAPTADARV